jgi:SET domain-containing protein
MALIFPSSNIYANQSSIEGLGVFARHSIKEGDVIEEAPLILIPEDQLSDLTKTCLLEYYFAWGHKFSEAAIGLGFASLYNHSFEPNAKYIKDVENSVLRFVAIKDIKQDEEIVVNYNGHPDDKSKLWFQARLER